MLKSSNAQLRLLTKDDLEQVLEWRNSDRVRVNMFNDAIITRDQHYSWFDRINGSQSSRHLIFSYEGCPLGIINVTNIDELNQRCYWGFYIGNPAAPKGSGAAMGYLGLEYIFESLKIRKLCSEAFAFNDTSVKYHLKLGFEQEGIFRQHTRRGCNYADIVLFALFKYKWIRIKKELARKCFGGDM